MSKKVVLIGDSIRMGYQDTVTRELAGRAEIIKHDENGGNSDRVLARLDEWVIPHAPDIIHLNCGLHDIRKDFGSDAAAVALDRYADNLRTIFARLAAATEAQIIWANTTPVNEVWHHENKGFDRLSADVDAYNAAARTIVDDLGIAVDDLFAAVTEAGRDNLLVADGVHFSPEGCALLGKAVADCIAQYL